MNLTVSLRSHFVSYMSKTHVQDCHRFTGYFCGQKVLRCVNLSWITIRKIYRERRLFLNLENMWPMLWRNSENSELSCCVHYSVRRDAFWKHRMENFGASTPCRTSNQKDIIIRLLVIRRRIEWTLISNFAFNRQESYQTSLEWNSEIANLSTIINISWTWNMTSVKNNHISDTVW